MNQIRKKVLSKQQKKMAAMEQRDDFCHIIKLPNEILVEIFRYLLTSDRECASLVCKRWLKLIDFMESQNTLLVIHLENFEELSQIATLRRLISRKKFRHVKVLHAPPIAVEKILTKCGKFFETFESPLEIFMALETYLLNIKTLKIIQSHEEIGSKNNLNNFANLRNIELSEPSSNTLSRFIMMSQPLQSIKVEFTNNIDDNQIDNLLEFLNRQASALKKIEIRLKAFDKTIKGKKWIETFSKMHILETLKFEFCRRENEENEGTFLNFLLQIFKRGKLGSLKKFSLCYHRRVKISQLVKLIPKCCSNMKVFQLSIPSIIEKDALSEVVKLERLSYLDLKSIQCHEILSELAHTENTYLTHLIFGEIKPTESDICAMARNHPNLRELILNECLTGITDTSLQYIYRYAIKLRQFSLLCCSKITPDGLTGMSGEFSIQRLRGLQILNLISLDKLQSQAISKVCFPELRVLNLNLCFLTTACMKGIVKNCNSIENIQLIDCRKDENNADFSEIVKTGLKRLKYFEDSAFIRSVNKSSNIK